MPTRCLPCDSSILRSSTWRRPQAQFRPGGGGVCRNPKESHGKEVPSRRSAGHASSSVPALETGASMSLQVKCTRRRCDFQDPRAALRVLRATTRTGRADAAQTNMRGHHERKDWRFKETEQRVTISRHTIPLSYASCPVSSRDAFLP